MTIKDYLIKTATFMGIEDTLFSVTVAEQSSSVRAEVQASGEIADRLIGPGGKNLEALQHLVNLVFRSEFEDKGVVLDINNYLAKKEEELIKQALEDAALVKKTGHEVVYRYLNSYERYLVHTAVANDEGLSGVTTCSTDVGGRRWLTISLKEVEKNSG